MTLIHTKRSRPRSSGTTVMDNLGWGFMKLPDEIITEILSYLDNSSLLRISQLSHLLNELSLRDYLLRHGLQLAFFIPSIRHVSFTSHNHNILRDLWLLRGLVSRLLPVDEIAIDFRRDLFYANVSQRDVMGAVRDLSYTAVRKSRTVLVLTGSPKGGLFTCRPRDISRWNLDKYQLGMGAELQERLADSMAGCVVMGCIWTLRGCFWKRFHSPYHVKVRMHNGELDRVGPVTFLETLHVQYLAPAPPFDAWTMITFNLPLITRLRLSVKLATEEWSAILPCISLPSLSEIHVASVQISLADLDLFLSRHSKITSFYCGPLSSLFTSSDYPPFPVTALPVLTHVQTSTNHLIHLLESKRALPKLMNISVWLHHGRVPVAAGNIMEPLNSALRCVARRRKAIHLKIDVRGISCIDTWLTVKEGEERIERSLHCVKSLTLHSPITDITPLPHWLALFPALHSVEFEYSLPLNMLPAKRQGFIRHLSTTCPGIQVIKVNYDERPVSGWINEQF